MIIVALLLLQTMLPDSSSSKELLELHQKAEGAMRNQEFQVAQESYKKLIEKLSSSSQKNFSWQNYVDSILRCAEALIALNECAEAEALLTRLLKEGAPPQFHHSIKLLRARSQQSGLSGLSQSYREMRGVQENFPFSQWSSEMRLFFHATEITLNDTYDEIMQRAERLAIAKEYEQALLLYQELERAVQEERYPKAMQAHSLIPKKIRLAIANLHYQLADYAETIAMTKEAKTIEDNIDCELIRLAAKAYSRALDYKEAISLLERLLREADPALTHDYQQSVYEIATLYDKTGQKESAKEHFLKILQRDEKESRIRLLARIALTQIFLEEEKFGLAKEELSILEKSDQCDLPFLGKVAFLQGQLALHEKEYHKAIALFKRALPSNRRYKTKILYSLAYCYLVTGEKSEEVEKLLQPLLESSEGANALLWIAAQRLYQGEIASVPSLLASHGSHFFDLEQQIIAFVLIAKATGSKEPLLLATDERYAQSPFYSYGWFCRGLYELDHQAITDSIYSLETAFLLRKDFSSSLLLTFLQQKEERLALQLLSQREDSTDEFLYIEALIAAYPRLEEGMKRAHILCQKLKGGKYHDQALYLTAILNYQNKEFALAKEFFLELSQREQSRALAAAGWYWAAESEEQLEPSSHLIADYRQQLFELYPKTIFGAESYFKFFPMDAYMQGERTALTHLAAFPELFPHSILQVAAYYLLALHEKEEGKKEALLQKAIALFDRLPTQYREKGAFYFRSRALLALGNLSLKKEPSQAIAYLRPLLKEIEKIEPQSALRDECRYLLAKAYANHGKYHRAQCLFLSIIEEETKRSEKTIFLALTWHALGDLSFFKGDMKMALESYELALQSGEGFLSEEDKLELWIRKSQCH